MVSDRLKLVPVTAGMKTAMQSSRAAFADLIGAVLPDGWPQFPEAFRFGGRESIAPWTGYLFLSRDEKLVLGNGGFVSEPDGDGTVEIGYEIAPAFWNRGYATEAASVLVQTAFDAGAVSVIAHSLAETNASNAVMRKLGMQFCGEIRAGDLSVWRWRIERQKQGHSRCSRPIHRTSSAERTGRERAPTRPDRTSRVGAPATSSLPSRRNP